MVRHFLLSSKEGMRYLITEVGQPLFKGGENKIDHFGVLLWGL